MGSGPSHQRAIHVADSSAGSVPRAAAVQPITIGAGALVACRSGVLVWPAERTLIVADLHLEKGSAFARRGQMLPPYDTRATLARLAAAIGRHHPRRVIALGDSFHDTDAPARLGDEEMRMLADMQRGRTWVWISGNHDPEHDPRLSGEAAAELTVADITLQHEPDAACDSPQIVGHLHPAARLVWDGASVRARCFASNQRCLVLPAFGAFTGGLNVLSEPFTDLFAGPPLQVHMLGRDGVYRVPVAALVGD